MTGIVDLHTHSWTSVDQLGTELAGRLRGRQVEQWGQLDGGIEAHDVAMDCVRASVIIGFRSELLGADIPIEYLADIVSRCPDRRIGFAGIDPMTSDALRQVDRALELGLSGVALAPACQAFHPTHSRAMLVYERCAANGLPVFVLQQEPLPASARMEFGHPAAWDEVARTFPDLPIVLSSLGFPWIDETFVLLSKHDRVFATISGVAQRPWQLYGALLTASHLGVMDKLLFGSGFPLNTPARCIESMYSVNAYSHGTQMPTISRSSIRAIVERDSLALLGVHAELDARTPDPIDDDDANDRARPAALRPSPTPRPTEQP
ncbi:MAG: amidohydrolase family protein [Phycisphaerales bacterium]|nr:amidohydrolase family protein [Phycisphaerales bacterium]